MNGFLTFLARVWQALAELSSRQQSGASIKAATAVRYGGANDLGHVGWIFDLNESEANAGSVENPKGTATCDPADMGYWDASVSDPMSLLRQHAYNDLKLIDLPKGDVVAACSAAKWVALQPYCVIGRNCLDDAYDVLRAYGVGNLPLPSRDLLPDKWFIDLDGQVAHVATYAWQGSAGTAFERRASHLARKLVPPQMPTWRTPGHPDWHKLQRGLAAASAGEGSMLYGIDVSSDQGSIDWNAVARSKQVSFAYARVFHSPAAGSFGDDSTFGANHDGCERAGIPFGAYFFYMAGQDGAEQADHFIEIADGRYGALVPMVDVEEGSGDQGWPEPGAARTDNLLACLERITARLTEPVIYTNYATWHDSFDDSSAFSKYRLWVVDQPAPPGTPTHVPHGWGAWTIHQYGIGHVPGIRTNVDLDCLNSQTGLGVIRRPGV